MNFPSFATELNVAVETIGWALLDTWCINLKDSAPQRK